MAKSCLILLAALAFGCGAHQEGVVATRTEQISTDNEKKLANLERSAIYPWRDNGLCAVQESSGDWATLVERCYGALDLHRIRFVDYKRACPIAQAGAISADQVTQLVGICLLVQPELAVGAVMIVGAVVVGAAILAEIEAIRAKKAGCYCSCFRPNDGPYPIKRVGSPAECVELCESHPLGPMKWICK